MSETAAADRLAPLRALRESRSRLLGVVLFLGGWQALSLFFPPSQFPGLEVLAENLVVIFSNETRFDVVANY
jgi:ABC-type nitrate/sulfonate/bicarbonate transport system permease component